MRRVTTFLAITGALLAVTLASAQPVVSRLDNGLTVVNGPTAMGMYTVAPVDEVDAASFMAKLEASPVTTFVAPVKR